MTSERASYKKDPSQDPHPFGGCDRLLEHYRTIGGALTQVEKRPAVLVQFLPRRIRRFAKK